MKLLSWFLLRSLTTSCHLGPVHTNPFSNENGAVLVRIRLSSTLQRRKRSPKTEPFENALQSGAIWKRCFLKTLGARPLDLEYPKWRTDATMWLQFRAKFAGRYIEMRKRRVYLSMPTEGIKAFSNRQIRRCSVDGRKRYENDKCGNKSFWNWKRISVDRALDLVATSLECLSGRGSTISWHLRSLLVYESHVIDRNSTKWSGH